MTPLRMIPLEDLWVVLPEMVQPFFGANGGSAYDGAKEKLVRRKRMKVSMIRTTCFLGCFYTFPV
jgi:hypothetical protein